MDELAATGAAPEAARGAVFSESGLAGPSGTCPVTCARCQPATPPNRWGGRWYRSRRHRRG